MAMPDHEDTLVGNGIEANNLPVFVERTCTTGCRATELKLIPPAAVVALKDWTLFACHKMFPVAVLKACALGFWNGVSLLSCGSHTLDPGPP